MKYRYGKAVSPGIAIGPALVLDTEGVHIPHRSVPPDQVGAEIARLGDQGRIPAPALTVNRRQEDSAEQAALAEDLVTLALLPRLESDMLSSEFRQHRSQVVIEARDLGFIAGDNQWELHPLLREFLLLTDFLGRSAPRCGNVFSAAAAPRINV